MAITLIWNLILQVHNIHSSVDILLTLYLYDVYDDCLHSLTTSGDEAHNLNRQCVVFIDKPLKKNILPCPACQRLQFSVQHWMPWLPYQTHFWRRGL